MVENKEIPLTLEPPSDLEIETSRDQTDKEVENAEAIEVSSGPVKAVDAGLSGKVEKTDEATKDASQAESESIFGGCGSFEKL